MTKIYGLILEISEAVVGTHFLVVGGEDIKAAKKLWGLVSVTNRYLGR